MSMKQPIISSLILRVENADFPPYKKSEDGVEDIEIRRFAGLVKKSFVATEEDCLGLVQTHILIRRNHQTPCPSGMDTADAQVRYVTDFL